MGIRNRGRLGFAALALSLALLVLLVGLAGCGPNGTASGPTPVPTLNGDSGTPGAHATLTLPTLTAAASPSGNTGQQGVNEFCSKPPNITIRPDAKIPAYPKATLHFSQANGSNAFYGFCTNDSTSQVQDFYAQKLPTSGWTGLQTSTIAAVVQITAQQCSSQEAPKIIVTIAPDATGAVTTSISIVVLAGTC
jgi:hypothetical protein